MNGFKTIRVINYDQMKSTINRDDIISIYDLSFNYGINDESKPKSYMVSKTDNLQIIVEFYEPINLETISFDALPLIKYPFYSPPQTVNIYKMTSMHDIIFTQTLHLSKNQLSKGQTIKINNEKFKSIQYLSISISSKFKKIFKLSKMYIHKIILNINSCQNNSLSHIYNKRTIYLNKTNQYGFKWKWKKHTFGNNKSVKLHHTQVPLICGFIRINCENMFLPSDIMEIIVRYFSRFKLLKTVRGRRLTQLGIDLSTNKCCFITNRNKNKLDSRFMNERNIMMELSRFNDCPPTLMLGIDCWEDNKKYFIAKHCYSISDDGSDMILFYILEKFHSKPKPNPNEFIQRIAKIFKDICIAIQWMHSKGYCHCDLSLDLITFCCHKQHSIKINCFRRAKKFENNNFLWYGQRSMKASQYMSPEEYNGDIHDARLTDAWSLGIILFCMIANAPLYKVPDTSDPAFVYAINRGCYGVLEHWNRLHFLTDNALNLMNSILKYEKDRITLPQMLKHPFFSENNV
eukprot:422404_1